jgi:hypothetical protein
MIKYVRSWFNIYSISIWPFECKTLYLDIFFPVSEQGGYTNKSLKYLQNLCFIEEGTKWQSVYFVKFPIAVPTKLKKIYFIWCPCKHVY